MKPTLVEAQSPSGFGKLPYTTSGPHILTNTGDIRILPFHFYYLIDIYIFISVVEARAHQGLPFDGRGVHP